MIAKIAWRWSYPARVIFPAIAERIIATLKILSIATAPRSQKSK
jgi:hypothetical protein